MSKQERRHKQTREVSPKNRFGIRLVIGLIFTVLLAVFIHFHEKRIDILEMGSVAPRYIVAEVDFSYPDADATMLLKTEALQDVGRIYRISEADIKRNRHRSENYLLHYPGNQRGDAPTFEDTYNTLDAIANALNDAHLTDSTTLKKREELGLPVDNYYIVPFLDSDTLNTLPDSFWKQASEKVLKSGKYHEKTVEFLITYLKGSKWKVYNDIDAEKFLKQTIEMEVPEKYTKVKAGGKIIDQGEKVKERHIAMLNAMKKQIQLSRNLWSIQSIISSLFIALIVVTTGGLYFYIRQKEFFNSIYQLSLYVTILILLFIFAKVVEWLLISNVTGWIEFVQYPIILPFSIALISILLNEEIALFTAFLFTIMLGVTLVFEQTYFMIMNLITSVFTIIVSGNLKKRKEIFVICFKVWLSAIFVVIGYNLLKGTLFAPVILIDFSATAINLLVIAVLILVFLPVLESVFNIMTDMALMEFMDPTSELLRRLSIEAPGTYQHSLTIGHMAEFVANAIGANGLFCRVTTLYHDVGKLNTPHYYTENQLLSGAKPFNIHLLLTPVESAYIIKSHVPDGVALAKQYKLPQPFIDIIEQHHGTTLIKFFYLKQVDEMGGNVEDVDENTFRYPGPKPQTKEAAVIMLCDSSEAASRSLEDNAEETIRNMVNKIVADKVGDGQFDQCQLTFKELFTIKHKLVEIIKATHHLRIKYPEPAKKA